MYTANVLTIKTMDFDHVPNPHKCLWAFHHSFNESWLICSVKKKLGADYEQLLRVCFSTFCGQKKNIYFENIVATALKSCIEKR